MNIEDLKEKYTFSQPVFVSYAPDAHTVWLRVNQQSFCIDGHQNTQEEADWMRTMLAKAMALVVKENSIEYLRVLQMIASARLHPMENGAMYHAWEEARKVISENDVIH